MQVKIDDKIYDANYQPIMVILSKGEREQITNMHPDATKYCQYPDHYNEDEIKIWMDAETTQIKVGVPKIPKGTPCKEIKEGQKPIAIFKYTNIPSENDIKYFKKWLKIFTNDA